MIDPWKFLDDLHIRVFCICLQERQDKYYSSRREFEKVKILDRVEYYRPQRHKKGGRIGCWESHQWCINQSNNQSLLIFEDDVVFSDDWYKQLYVIENFLKSYKDEWNFFYLGSLVCELLEKNNYQGISRIKCVGLHSYFISKNCIQYLKNLDYFNPNLNKNLHIDTFYYYNLPNNSFILNEPITYQKNTTSDNELFVKFVNNYLTYYFQNYRELHFKINNFLYITCQLPKYLNPTYIFL